MPAHKFRCSHECALRSDEVVHSLVYIQYRKNTQNADEDKVELLDEKILGWDEVLNGLGTQIHREVGDRRGRRCLELGCWRIFPGWT